MSERLPPVARLDEALKAAGVPILGVYRERGADWTVRFAPEVTQGRRDQAAAIVAAFDARPRRPRPLASIAADIAGLSAADRNRLMTAVCAAYLQDHPGFARALSLAIDGDEPEA